MGKDRMIGKDNNKKGVEIYFLLLLTRFGFDNYRRYTKSTIR